MIILAQRCSDKKKTVCESVSYFIANAFILRLLQTTQVLIKFNYFIFSKCLCFIVESRLWAFQINMRLITDILKQPIYDPGAQNQSYRSIFGNWDLYITWKLNKWSFHWCMVCYDRTIFVNLESEGAKKSKYWENHL